MQTDRNALTEGVIWKKLLFFALPILLGNIFQQMYNTADALIVGSPCYWGNMSGQLKILFDRLVYGLMGESPKGFPLPLHKGKKAVIVSTGSTPWPFNIWFNQTRGTVKALREILKWSGFSVQGVLQKGGTKQHHELTMKELQKCKTLIKRLTI